MADTKNLRGLDAHLKRLQRMGGAGLNKAIKSALFGGGEKIEQYAAQLITTGGGVNSGPSAPGTPPNSHTDNLQKNIRTDYGDSELEVKVTSNAEYAAIQEFGGTIRHPGGTPYFMRDGKPVFVSNKGVGAFHGLPKTKPHDITLPARPYMLPARDAKEKEVRKDVLDAVNKFIKTTGGKG